MTNDSLNKDIADFAASVEKWEAAGLAKSQLTARCRLLLVSLTSYSSQVTRAITFLKEGKVAEALTELGS